MCLLDDKFFGTIYVVGGTLEKKCMFFGLLYWLLLTRMQKKVTMFKSLYIVGFSIDLPVCVSSIAS